MVDIQCVTVIMGGREISRPYQTIDESILRLPVGRWLEGLGYF